MLRLILIVIACIVFPQLFWAGLVVAVLGMAVLVISGTVRSLSDAAAPAIGCLLAAENRKTATAWIAASFVALSVISVFGPY